jgi:hypothetical protein
MPARKSILGDPSYQSLHLFPSQGSQLDDTDVHSVIGFKTDTSVRVALRPNCNSALLPGGIQERIFDKLQSQAFVRRRSFSPDRIVE